MDSDGEKQLHLTIYQDGELSKKKLKERVSVYRKTVIDLLESLKV